MTLDIGLDVEDDALFSFDYRKAAKEVVCYVLEREGFPYEAEVYLRLTDNQGIRQANEEFRQINGPTDVLSFPMICYEKAGDFSLIGDQEDNFNPDTGEAVLGDIMINVDRVKEQAESYGHSELREFAFLIVHSMLHLFGYDHIAPADASIMEPLQEKILEELNILR